MSRRIKLIPKPKSKAQGEIRQNKRNIIDKEDLRIKIKVTLEKLLPP